MTSVSVAGGAAFDVRVPFADSPKINATATVLHLYAGRPTEKLVRIHWNKKARRGELVYCAIFIDSVSCKLFS